MWDILCLEFGKNPLKAQMESSNTWQIDHPRAEVIKPGGIGGVDEDLSTQTRIHVTTV